MIRKAVFEDVRALKRLHDRAVMELCRSDYTSEQLRSWIDRSPLEKYYWRLETQRIFLAEKGGMILGYVRWYPDTNELCSICVEPEYTRQGIGTALMEWACKDAREQGVDRLWLDASLTAVPFYLSLGWEKGATSKGGLLDSVRMTKDLEQETDQGRAGH